MLDGGLEDGLRYALQAPESVLRSVFDDRTCETLARRSEHSAATAYRLAVLGRWQQLMPIG
jgi:hypothetical protein